MRRDMKEVLNKLKMLNAATFYIVIHKPLALPAGHCLELDWR